MRHVAGFLVALALIGIQPGQAQQSDDPSADSRLNAFACEMLPTPLRVDVQILDNAERHVRFRDTFVARLRKAGVEVASNAPLILTLEVRKVVEFERREGGEFFELRAGQENENIGRGFVHTHRAQAQCPVDRIARTLAGDIKTTHALDGVAKKIEPQRFFFTGRKNVEQATSQDEGAHLGDELGAAVVIAFMPASPRPGFRRRSR